MIFIIYEQCNDSFLQYTNIRYIKLNYSQKIMESYDECNLRTINKWDVTKKSSSENKTRTYLGIYTHGYDFQNNY